MGYKTDVQATRSSLQSVDTTLSEDITATQDYIPVASTTNFSTSVVAEIESTNEVVSFDTITIQKLKQTGFASSWPLRRITKTSSAGTAPDGTNTAVSIVPTVDNNTHRIDQNPAGLATNTEYTFSVYGKQNGYTGLSLTVARGANEVNTQGAYFDLNSGSVASAGSGVSGNIQDAGNGWFRCAITTTTAGSLAVDGILIGVGSDSSTFSFAGNTTDGILIWGPQLEISSSVTGFLPNETNSTTYPGLTTVTRGVNGTTAQAASSGDSIQQLPFAFQQVLATVTSTLSENIDATQNYVPVASTSGFVTGVNATIESTNEVVSFTTLTENKAKFSEQLNNGVYTKSGISIDTDVTTAPDGTSTADRIKRPASTGTKNMYQSGISVISGNDYTFSIYLKKDNNDFFQLGFFAGISSGYVNFDLVNGIFSANAGASGSMTAVGNDWYLCTMTATSGLTGNSGFQILPIDSYTDARNASFTNTTSYDTFAWGFSVQESSSFLFYLPTTANTLVGLGNVTRGVNGTTAQAASSGASISQTPSLASLNTPIRLRGLSISPDGTGAARLTLCDNNGDSILDIDTPDGKVYTMNMPEAGLIFPNGVFVSNTENVTAYTLYTEKYSGPGLTAG